MDKVLVTGVDGFTGRHLAPVLHQCGFEVHGMTARVPVADVHGVSEFHICDLADADGVRRVVESVRPKNVVHLAAISYVAHGSIEAIYLTNIVGTRNLLEALVSAQAPVDAVLLASSANIYGNSTRDPIDEDTASSPVNDYAVSKVGMEFVAKLYVDRLPIILTRPFNYTGLGQSINFVIPKIVDHVLRGVSTIELGNVNVAREFSDVRWVVEAYRRLLQTPHAVGDVFNICSGRAYTLQNVLDAVRDISGSALKVRINPAFVRANEVKVLRGSPKKLAAAIGVFSEPTLEQTLRWMLGV